MKFITIGRCHIELGTIGRFYHRNGILFIFIKGDTKEYTCKDADRLYYKRLCEATNVCPCEEVSQQ